MKRKAHQRTSALCPTCRIGSFDVLLASFWQCAQNVHIFLPKEAQCLDQPSFACFFFPSKLNQRLLVRLAFPAGFVDSHGIVSSSPENASAGGIFHPLRRSEPCSSVALLWLNGCFIFEFFRSVGWLRAVWKVESSLAHLQGSGYVGFFNGFVGILTHYHPLSLLVILSQRYHDISRSPRCNLRTCLFGELVWVKATNPEIHPTWESLAESVCLQ